MSGGDYDDQQPVHHYCGVCGGPCLSWAGSVHRWTCQGCLRAYVADGIARADKRAAAERANLAAKLSAPKPTTATTAGAEGKQRAAFAGSGRDGRELASGRPDRPGAVREHRDRVTR